MSVSFNTSEYVLELFTHISTTVYPQGHCIADYHQSNRYNTLTIENIDQYTEEYTVSSNQILY